MLDRWRAALLPALWIALPFPALADGHAARGALVAQADEAEETGKQACVPACRTGYLCVEGKCVSSCNPPCAAGQVCRADGECVAARSSATPNPAGPDAADDPLGGVHLFAGLQVGPGFSAFWPGHQTQMQFRASGQFAMRLGAVMNRFEVNIEFSPDTFWPGDFAYPLSNTLDSGAHLLIDLTIGYLAEVTKRLYWPIRFGGGIMAVGTPRTVFGLLRLDLLGIGYVFPLGPGQLAVEATLPSLRFHSEIDLLGIWSWMFNISAVYLFGL